MADMDNECRSSSLTSESSDNGEEIPSTPVESKFTRKHTRYSHHQTKCNHTFSEGKKYAA
jgi:hypothetical protein